MRIVFMGSPEFAVPSLEHLYNNRYKIKAVYTQPDRPAGRGRKLVSPEIKNAALKMGLTVVQPESLRTEEELARLAEFKPELIVVCAFGQILTQPVLDIPPLQCVNVHFSLLPRHRGASPVASAIINGDEFAGVSIQLVRRKLDTGPILARAAVPIMNRDNTGTMTGKLAIVGANLLLESLTGWTRGEIKPIIQDDSQSTYFKQVSKEEGEIDWSNSAVDIWRRIRAFNPWPGCYTRWRGKNLKILEAEVVSDVAARNPGEVVKIGEKQGLIGVATGEGVLGILKLQLEGKRVMSYREFMTGQPEIIGSTLEN